MNYKQTLSKKQNDFLVCLMKLEQKLKEAILHSDSQAITSSLWDLFENPKALIKMLKKKERFNSVK